MVIFNYLGTRRSELENILNVSNTQDIAISSSIDSVRNSYSTVTPYSTYQTLSQEYLAHEVDFIAAGIDFVVKGMFVPGDSKPYVLRNLPGPDKYITTTHEYVHKEFHDAGIPQSESEVRRITSERTDFKDYYA